MAYGKPTELNKYFVCILDIVRYIFNSGGAEEIWLLRRKASGAN